MSFFKSLLGVAASIAVPFLAPKLVKAFAASTLASGTALGAALATKTGATIGSTIVGAGLGAASQKALGGSATRGALMGGIGGGIGGYTGFQGPTAATPTAATPTAATPTAAPWVNPNTGVPSPTTASMNVSPTISTAGGTTLPTAPTTGVNVLPTSVAAPGSTTSFGTFLPGGEFSTAAPVFSGPGANQMFLPTATSALGPVSGATSSTIASAAPAAPLTLSGETTRLAGLGVPGTSLVSGQDLGFSPLANMGVGPGGSLPAFDPSQSLTLRPSTQAIPGNLAGDLRPATQTAQAAAGAEGAGKGMSNTTRAMLTLAAANALAGEDINTAGMSAEEAALFQEYIDQLREAQTANRALFDQRLQQAQAIIGGAEYFDPEYFGLQAARRAQIAAGKAEREAARGRTGAARDVAIRQAQIAGAKNVGTAFDTAYGTGVQGRLNQMNAGLNAMPSEYPVSNFGPAFNRFDVQADRARLDRERLGQDVGNLFESLFA